MDRRSRDRGMYFARVCTRTRPTVRVLPRTFRFSKVLFQRNGSHPVCLSSRSNNFFSSFSFSFTFAITHTNLARISSFYVHVRVSLDSYPGAVSIERKLCIEKPAMCHRYDFHGSNNSLTTRSSDASDCYVITEKEDLSVGNDMETVASVETRRMFARIIIIHFFPKHSVPCSVLPLSVYYSTRNISFARSSVDASRTV